MSNAPNARFAGVAGYFTPNDGYRHAIVATTEGRLYEIFFSPRTGHGQSYFGAFPAISGLAAFFTPDDGFQHLLVARLDGFIEEVYFQPGNINFATPIGRIGGIIGIDGFYSEDDHYRHVIVATNAGDIHEIFYHPSIGTHQSRPALVNFAGIVAIAAFYTPDDHYRHVIVATSDGNIREVFYHPSIGVHVSNPPLANLQGVRAVAGFYTDDDRYRHVIAGTGSGDVFEIFYSPSTGSFVSRPPLGHFDPTPPARVDLAPDSATATTGQAGGLQRASTGGQIVRITGDAKALYCVGTTSGVWKSIAGGQWAELRGSPGNNGLLPPPPLVADPKASSHVAIGAADGLWESTDGGLTWTRSLDPASLGCASSFVSGLTFTQSSTLVAGLACGIARRDGSGKWTLHRTSAPVTALVASSSQVFARTTRGGTAASLLFSTDDGGSWSSEVAIPGTFSFRFNEFDSLGAVDGFAYMVSGGNDPGSPCGRDNRLLIFKVQGATFKEQSIKYPDAKGNLTPSCDGTGSGVTGHKFIKSFVRADALPAVVGQKLQLFYCAGQELLQATGINIDDGTVTSWNWIMGTSGYSGRDPVHADPWDFALDTEAGGATAWVAGDGGVFAFKNPTPYSFTGASWTPQLDGLHGHQMITLSVMQSSPISRSRLAYPTSHNDGWIRTSTWTVLPEPVWDACEAGGDVNWTNGDSSSPRWALLARQQTIATLVHFTATPDRRSITLLNTKLNRDAMGNVNPLPTNIGPGGPLTFQFIQGAKADGKFAGLDAVMAVDLPLTKPWDSATNTNPILIPGPLAADSKGQPVLIRNKQFDANADINASGGKGWAIEIPSFPANAMGIFVTGGRAAPVYYTFTGSGELFRWGGASWGTPILTGLGFDANTNGVYGPVFVNPYDARVVFAIAGTAIVRSTNGGSTFAPDAALTALVTAGGKHPPATLRCMAFHYEDPDEIAAGGDAGVFFRTGAGAWRNLTRFLPTPRLPAVAVGIDTEFVYIAENGRSLYGIRGYKNA